MYRDAIPHLEFILDFMVRTALTVHEILNIYPISRYEFILDFMVRTALTVIIKDYREIFMKYF